MRCPSCGKEAPDGAKFCPSCGSSLPERPKEMVCEALTAADVSKPDASGAVPGAVPGTVPAVDKAEMRPLGADGRKAEHPAEGLADLTAKLTAKAAPAFEGTAEGVKAEDGGKAAGDPKPKGAHGATGGSVPAVKHGAKPASKKMPKLALIGIAAVLVVVAGLGVSSLFGGSDDPSSIGGQDMPISDSKRQEGDESEQDGEMDEDGSNNGRFEELTVSDVKIDVDAPEGPKVTLTVTNNQQYIVTDTQISATGTFMTTNNYGDEVEDEGALNLICTDRGTGTIAYLFPGKNEVELIPYYRDNIVIDDTNGYTGETQSYRLQDLNDIEVSVNAGDLIDPNQYKVLDEDEYVIDLKMARDGGSPVLNVKLVNKSDYRWRKATVYFVAVDASGQRAHKIEDSYNDAAFEVGPVSENYFNVGESKDMSASFSSDLDVDHFEVQRVVVERELVETGEKTDK